MRVQYSPRTDRGEIVDGSVECSQRPVLCLVKAERERFLRFGTPSVFEHHGVSLGITIQQGLSELVISTGDWNCNRNPLPVQVAEQIDLVENLRSCAPPETVDLEYELSLFHLNEIHVVGVGAK